MSRCEKNLLKFRCSAASFFAYSTLKLLWSVVLFIRVYTANSYNKGANSDLGVSQDAICSTYVQGAFDCHLNRLQTRVDGSSSGALQRGPRIKKEKHFDHLPKMSQSPWFTTWALLHQMANGQSRRDQMTPILSNVDIFGRCCKQCQQYRSYIRRSLESS